MRDLHRDYFDGHLSRRAFVGRLVGTGLTAAAASSVAAAADLGAIDGAPRAQRCGALHRNGWRTARRAGQGGRHEVHLHESWLSGSRVLRCAHRSARARGDRRPARRHRDRDGRRVSQGVAPAGVRQRARGGRHGADGRAALQRALRRFRARRHRRHERQHDRQRRSWCSRPGPGSARPKSTASSPRLPGTSGTAHQRQWPSAARTSWRPRRPAARCTWRSRTRAAWPSR